MFTIKDSHNQKVITIIILQFIKILIIGFESNLIIGSMASIVLAIVIVKQLPVNKVQMTSEYKLFKKWKK